MAHLRPIDKEYEDADDTGVLNLSGRNLRGIPNVPGDLCDIHEYVFEADLSKNRFDRVPEEVCTFRALVKLNCYHNTIRSVPEDIMLLSNLTDVDLSRNFLQQIPPGLCRLNLLSLNLNNNRLVSLPLELGKLKQLRHLDLSCNMLPDLPPSIVLLQSLQHLDLHRNELKDLPQEIYKLPVRFLDVSGNCLGRLPTTLRLIDTLTNFLVSDNPLESPPTQVCVRGLVHIFKYLESLEKRGSDPHLISLTNRDESLRRRKDRMNRRTPSSRPLSENPGMNGHPLDLYNEMATLVNTAFADDTSTPVVFKNDGDITPTGGAMHWSIAQYINPNKSQGMSDQSKEEYREAAHRLYMEQERQKSKLKKLRSSSPPTNYPSKTSPQHTTQTSTHYGTLPKSRKGSKDEDALTDMVKPHVGGPGRSLPSEKFPRSGSWNSHMRKTSSPVLPSKYSMPADKARGEEKESPEDSERDKVKQVQKDALKDFMTRKSSQSATELRTVGMDSRSPRTTPKKRPPPLDSTTPTHTSTPRDRAPDSPHSSRDGSVTPTNEELEEMMEEPHTPKHRTTQSLDNLLESTARETEDKDKVFHSAENLLDTGPTRESLEVKRKARSASASTATEAETEIMVIQDLEEEPRRRVPSAGDAHNQLSPADGTWPRLNSPRRKKKADVFRFLTQHDPNYTIRRQELQMNIIIEKNQVVKTTIETLMDVTLSDDIGEWITDGVLLCQIVNKLHPGTIPIIHIPSDGQALSGPKQTMNIAAFIAACRNLHVPEEELCSAGDIVEMRDPVRVITCLQRVLDTATGKK